MKLDWDKGRENQQVSSVDYMREMGQAMDDICELLSVETKDFDAKTFLGNVYGYILSRDRLLYTNITNYIFTLGDEQFGVLQTNIDHAVNYMYSDNYQEDFAEEIKSKKRECERTQRTVLKMWDHINLARRQYVLFYHNDKDYAKIVDEKMEFAEAKIAKEMNVQLISLVAIFTALSFLVFGGVSSLDNIFLGAKDIPVLKLIIVGGLWCFCIMNLIFTFMFFIAKLTGLSIKSTEDINANIIKKYPLVWWANYVIIFIMILSGWIYYVRRNGLIMGIDLVVAGNPMFFATVGIIIIITVMSGVAKKIYEVWSS